MTSRVFWAYLDYLPGMATHISIMQTGNELADMKFARHGNFQEKKKLHSWIDNLLFKFSDGEY